MSREVLTPQISKMIETPIFGSGCVVGTTHYAQFCPIPSPFLLIFSKNDFEVLKVLENQQKPQNCIYEKKVNKGGRNWTKLSIEGGFLTELKIDVSIMLEIWGVNITLGTLCQMTKVTNDCHYTVRPNEFGLSSEVNLGGVRGYGFF